MSIHFPDPITDVLNSISSGMCLVKKVQPSIPNIVRSTPKKNTQKPRIKHKRTKTAGKHG